MRSLPWPIQSGQAMGALSRLLLLATPTVALAANAGPMPDGASGACPDRDCSRDTTLASSALSETEPAIDLLLQQALTHLKERDYAAARSRLLQAQPRISKTDPQFHEVLLLLGICAYRLHKLEQAEVELAQAAESTDQETRGQAGLFLSQVYAEQGAADQARRELSNAAGSLSLRESAERLLRQSRPHRLYLSLLVSPEYDANVPLTPLYVAGAGAGPWQSDARASMDGDVLFLASLGVRPLRYGLLLGNTISYRQQLRLSDFNLLLNSTWLHFSHLTANHRLRLSGAFSLAVLGPSFLYLDGAGRVQYRRRLHSQWGLSGTYEARYRDYRTAEFAALSGLVQSAQVELGFGLAPQPVSFGVGYQGLREQTQSPDSSTDLATATSAVQDFRAWVHGPLLWFRARLHSRVELSINSTFLHRLFDSGRVDLATYQDVNLQVALLPWLSGFVGGSVLYNASSEAFFHYVKPAASVGLLAYLGVL